MAASSQGPLAGVAGTVVLVGAGRLGSPLFDGWLGRGLEPASVVAIEPQPTPELAALARRGLRLNPAGAPPAAAAIVIAVKPQMASDVAPALAAHIGAGTLALSIMAGRTLGFLEASLPPGTAVV